MRRNFCTYFDYNYLVRGLALYESLARHCRSFRLWVLCMDQKAYDVLGGMCLADMELIRLEDFEHKDDMLRQAKKDRSRIEYYFTCTPSLLLFIFERFPEVELLTYIDADLYFFTDPLSLYKEISGKSIAIIEHRYSVRDRKNAAAGIYNVGWLSFRHDQNAVDCLGWWRRRCNEWCFDRPQAGRFADQKYLDDWPQRFNNVVVVKDKGANLAVWNIGNYKIYKDAGGLLRVDGHPLVFFHFHGLRHIAGRIYDTGLGFYNAGLSQAARRFIYEPYLKTLLSIAKRSSGRQAAALRIKNTRRVPAGGLLAKTISRIRYIWYLLSRVIVQNNYVIAPKG